ncbi:MAG TPA: hypothetical protein VL727_23550 [Puia sp.]|nr:hypothetical protein [Puia sp.]
MQKEIEKEKYRDLSRWHAFNLTLAIFAISILPRIPALTRPVSKHHEFNAAIILIGIESWRQAGGGAGFHYAPLMNYQHPGDLYPEKAVNIDNKGNELYLSLGPGWYIIPYAFFQLLHLPATPLNLRLLSLLINGLTVILSFFLFEQLIPAGTSKRFTRICTATALFMFSPGMLWYLGNGYVHVTALLPFLLLMLILLLPMLRSPENISAIPLSLLALSVILSVYMDWFMLFLCAAACPLTLFWARKNPKYFILTGVLFISLFTGIALIFWQFASYTSTWTVAEYWRRRFVERSFVNNSAPFTINLLSIAGHFVTAYLPVLLFILAGLVIHRVKKIPAGWSRTEIRFAILYTVALCLNMLVLNNWASQHEYSVVPAALLLAWIGATLFPAPAHNKFFVGSIGLFFILSTAQFYYINPAGPIARSGMPYNTYQTFGQHLRGIPPRDKIFANLPENCPMIDYYAGRNITLAQDSSEAKQMMRKWNIDTAIWVESEEFQFKATRILSTHPPSAPSHPAPPVIAK